MSTNSITRIPGNWKVLEICPNQELTASLKPLLSDHLTCVNIVEVGEYPKHDVLMDLVESHAPNLCLLDVDTNREWALALIPSLIQLNDAVPIVAVLRENNPDLILRCLRLGALEFLLSPVTSEQIVPVLERVANQHPAGVGGGQDLGSVICVVPAKGACGASTIACNLAFQVKHSKKPRVLLADLDPFSGIQAFLLKVKASYNFTEALSRSGNMDADIFKGMVTHHRGIDVLLAPEKPVHGIDELQDPAQIINFARQTYDHIVVDCGSPYGAWSISLARLCDTLLLVTTNELPAVQAAQRTLSYFDRNRVDRSKVRIVVNRYHREVGVTTEVIQAALHTEIFQTLPSEYEELQNALVEGRPLSGSSPLSKGLLALANRLNGKALKPEDSKRTSSFGSLLSIFTRALCL